MKSASGFTLLEVIIAMMIMAFLSLFTVDAIQKAVKTKAKVQKEIDKTSTLRDALRIMERDINMAFNYRDIAIELYNQTQTQRAKKSGQTSQQRQGESDAEFQIRLQQEQAAKAAAGGTDLYKPKSTKL